MADSFSESLRNFIAEAPAARGGRHIAFLQRAAAELMPGSTILDVGAGDAPYRELFAHGNYLTCDWENSNYRPDRPPDIVAPASNIPLEVASVDAILCTQVLEHVAEPASVLAEFFRLLKPGGRLWLLAPLVWYLHEEPDDYYRYTSHGLRFLLERAEFIEIEVNPLNNAFSTTASLVRDLGWMMGRSPDGFDSQREIVAQTMVQVASLIEAFANFDTQWIFPIGFSAVAVRPDDAH
jgi:SAM-dependent methyltransferase